MLYHQTILQLICTLLFFRFLPHINNLFHKHLVYVRELYVGHLAYVHDFTDKILHMLQKMSILSFPHGCHNVLVVQSSSSTSESVMFFEYWFFHLPSFQLCLSSILFFPYHLKQSSWTIFLCSNNPGICGQTHCSCRISWCDNVQQCVPHSYISNILSCY